MNPETTGTGGVVNEETARALCGMYGVPEGVLHQSSSSRWPLTASRFPRAGGGQAMVASQGSRPGPGRNTCQAVDGLGAVL